MSTTPPPRFRDRARPQTGPFAKLEPWTAEADELLKSTYAAGGLKAARVAFPSRSSRSICLRARRLGVQRRPLWKPEEDARLRSLWTGEHDLAEIAARLGRSAQAVNFRARKLGLPATVPVGWEVLNDAAERTGFDAPTLLRILAADGASIRPALSLKARGRPRDPSHRARQRNIRIVSTAEVDAAVAAWAEEEPVDVAARRVGVCRISLVRRLRALGLRPPAPGKHWRVTAEQVEAATAIPLQRGRRMQAVVQAGGRRRGTAAAGIGSAP